jgi:hypothetical protein
MDTVITTPYGSSQEYLADEIKHLNLLLRLHIAEEQQSGISSQLSAEEICQLLGGDISSCYDINLLTNELTQLNSQINARRETSLQQGIYLSLPHTSKIYGLSPFEERCIIICLAPELDRKYEKVYSSMQNDIGAKSPSIDFILQLLTGLEEERTEYRKIFEPHTSLMRYLMETGGSLMDPNVPLIARFLKLDCKLPARLPDAGRAYCTSCKTDNRGRYAARCDSNSRTRGCYPVYELLSGLRTKWSTAGDQTNLLLLWTRGSRQKVLCQNGL